jgi:hypothetical protein
MLKVQVYDYIKIAYKKKENAEKKNKEVEEKKRSYNQRKINNFRK